MNPGTLCYNRNNNNYGQFSGVVITSKSGRLLVEVVKNRGGKVRTFPRRHDVPVGYISVGLDEYAYVSPSVLTESTYPFKWIMTFQFHTLKGKREILRQLEQTGFHFPASKANCDILYSDFTMKQLVGVYTDGFNLKPIMESEASMKISRAYKRIQPSIDSTYGIQIVEERKTVAIVESDEVYEAYFDTPTRPLLGDIDEEIEENDEGFVSSFYVGRNALKE